MLLKCKLDYKMLETLHKLLQFFIVLLPGPWVKLRCYRI